MSKFQRLTSLGLVLLGATSNAASGIQFESILHYSCFQTLTDGSDYSKQSNYANFYIKTSARGEITFFNRSYRCPMVQEGLYNQNTFWPSDSSFALAKAPTPEFSVAVEANSSLATGSDADQNRSCSGSASRDPSSPFVKDCLGFAALPKADGSCAHVNDSFGKTIPLYRLRRYFSIEPTMQTFDTVYILDRPVRRRAGPDSTMLGPKPCPAAYFDKTNAYSRPWKGYFPHFVEDTDFHACAPQASPFKDAPLHFSKNPVTGNIAWCAESYPTQNINIFALDPPVQKQPGDLYPTIPSGSITNYTSHTVRNSASRGCIATPISIPTANYKYDLAPGSQKYALHSATTKLPWENNLTTANQTCDRTILSNAIDWPRFPLLASSDNVEAAIGQDGSYECSIVQTQYTPTQHTPSGGCCDQRSVFIRSGLGGEHSAHLEPDVACGVPID